MIENGLGTKSEILIQETKMPKIYRLPLEHGPGEFIKRAEVYDSNPQIRFDGNHEGGEFNAYGVRGTYKFMENLVEVIIHDKPFLVPWAIVENQVREFFA